MPVDHYQALHERGRSKNHEQIEQGCSKYKVQECNRPKQQFQPKQRKTSLAELGQGRLSIRVLSQLDSWSTPCSYPNQQPPSNLGVPGTPPQPRTLYYK
ncbi:UNVERIFIED_CONTAM: hypothetical protein Slati_2519000 [Sesamum latifolium]|uniref:Uncharacterized protein n=1 Tax=Sesamum latifolium TaxID=2727402 RepID=A0AAW2WG97_9LAMI